MAVQVVPHVGGGLISPSVKSCYPAQSLWADRGHCEGGWTRWTLHSQEGNRNIQMPGHSSQQRTVPSLIQENWILIES